MSDVISVVTASSVELYVSTSASQFTLEKRFPKNLTVAELKGRLEMLTGGSPASMSLQLFNNDDALVATLDDDTRQLGFYPVTDGMRLHVVDRNARMSDLHDSSGPQCDDKFALTAEEYDKRTDTVKSYLVRHKLGKYAEGSDSSPKMAEDDNDVQLNERIQLDYKVGSRCQVTLTNQLPKRGQITFVGKTHFQSGWWIGVQYDEPCGKNDGSVGDQRYFRCPDKYGGFVRPQMVVVGDFPELDIDDDDEM